MASSDKNNDVHQDYNRKMLVDAIAANIYFNIKENNDISKLLAEGMAQSGEDKGTMIQALMGRLLAAPPSTTKNNAHILNSLDTTLESTTPSGSRAISPEASEATLLLDDAKSDFIYQSSCKIQEKGYMGPSGPTPHDQLPLPVAELAIPLSVQELSNKNAPEHKQINYQTRTSTVQRASSFNNGQRSTVTAEVVEGKRRMSLSSEDKKVITLPPKPSASFSVLNNTKPKPQETDSSDSTAQKSSTANTNNNTTATATPVEAAGKPRKFKNLVIRVKSKLNEVDKKKWDSSNSNSSSSTITNSLGCQKSCDSTILQNISNSAVISSNKFESSKETMTSSQECTTNNSGIETKHEIEEERCDSRQSQRSLSPLSVGPIPVPPATQKSTTVAVDAPSDFPPGIREIPITLTSTTYNQMLQQKYEEQMSSSTTTTTTTNQLAHQNSGNCSSKKMREFDTAQWADKNLTAKPYCSVNGAKSEAASHEKSSNKEVDKKEFEACEMRSVNMSGDTSGACLPDPSIILLSPTPSHNKKDYLSRSESEKSFEIIDNLHEEVHHVKEDKARALLNDKLKDSIHDMVAYQKYEGEEKSHFQELKTKQKTCQKDFHEKLYKELTKESGTKTSYVAEALNLTHGKSANEDNQLQSSSVPSHSPVTSRRGSQTWQYKSQLWCNSLPRKKQRVKFEDDASPPERPPPPVDENKPPAEQPTPPARSQQSINQQNAPSPNQTKSQSINQTNAQPVYNAPQPPARQQSINTMKNLSPITSAYNNALIETTKAINNGTFTTDTLTDSYNHTHKQATPKDNTNVNNDHKQAPPTFLTKKSTNTNWVNEDPYKKKLDYNLEFGNRKDPWMDHYGKSVLDNTLRDKIETRRSRWTGTGGRTSSRNNSADEIYEHEPVHSTDRLEKPRHINPPQASASPGYASCTLPRKRMNFNGASPGDLKRNNSMSDLPLTPSPEPGCQRSWPSSNQIFRREHNSFTTPKGCLSRSGSTELKPPKPGPSEQGSRSCTPDQRNQNQSINKQENNSNNQTNKAKDNSKNYDINENVSVPLHVVKAVVLSVLEKQGVPNPSDDVINKAIQEFYSKQNSISDF